MKNHWLFFVIGSFFCLSIVFPNLATTAELYKWTDEKGQVHYTREPPPNWTPAIGSHSKARTVETIDTEDLKKRNIVPSLGSSHAASKENESQGQPQEERKPSSLSDDATAGMKCELARHNAQILQSDAPVFIHDKQGNKVILDAQQREAALIRVQKDIERSCEPVTSPKELAASSITPAIPAESKPADKKEEPKIPPTLQESSRETSTVNLKQTSELTPSESHEKAVAEKPVTAEKPLAILSVPSKTEAADKNSKSIESIGRMETIKIAILAVCFILTTGIMIKLPPGLKNPFINFFGSGVISKGTFENAKSIGVSEGCLFFIMRSGGNIVLFTLLFALIYYGLNSGLNYFLMIYR